MNITTTYTVERVEFLYEPDPAFYDAVLKKHFSWAKKEWPGRGQ
jgi:hypothetical protein